MNKHLYEATICINYLNIPFYICNIEYEIHEDESFSYKFYPNYKVIDILPKQIFQGIPGIDLSLRKAVYERNNITPTFISERVPQNNREDLYEILEDVGLDYLNPILYLIRTKKQYSGDNLYLIEKENINQKVTLGNINAIGNNLLSTLHSILIQMGKGNNIVFDDYIIDESNYSTSFYLISHFYEKATSYQKDTNKSNYGRKRKNTNELLIKETIELYKNKLISAEDAAKRLNVSRRTFFRILSR